MRSLFDQARTNRRIEYTDLPSLDRATRSQDLQDRFPIHKLLSNSNPRGQPLWKIIISENYHTLAKQWTLAIAESIIIMSPPVCLYKVLSLLEQRVRNSSSLANDRSELLLWVLGLTISKTLHVGLDQWVQWFSFASFAIPVRSQLSAVIFAKSMRMKAVEGIDIKDNKKNKDNDKGDQKLNEIDRRAAEETDPLLPKPDSKEAKQDAEPSKVEGGFRNDIVNLLGVDVQRVSEFCAWNVDMGRGFVQIAISAGVLVYLIGWWSTLAGFAVPILLSPLTSAATRRYLHSQVLAMSSRDKKAYVVTEALQGIRQIKFSASEEQWETRILATRDKELQAQWQVYLWTIFLTSIWIIMPALIGATALSVYAILGGQMLASVTFTALSVFTCLERTITALPQTITEMIDAAVSAARIGNYLNMEEKPESLGLNIPIEFKDACIAWPSNSPSPEDFQLQALNLRFPRNELSVIHGKTGTGKSLLLAAIIGEADITSGSVSMPQAPSMYLRDNETISEDDWLIPTAIAYVGQIPWIENTTVKEAILFGLPYFQKRYFRVLQASALQDDIGIFPDGEDTEIGATGINLSGGQRWRLTLARALYSRASILVMDDIFSAVDSHVGRHLLEHAILGSLGVSRTKILVTHHIGLVERYAAYSIELNDRTALNVTQKGSDEALENVGYSTQTGAITSGGDDAHILSSDQSKIVGIRKIEPRKFVQDETRAQGRVKWSVYKTYYTNSGGRSYWILASIFFALGGSSTLARSWWLALWAKSYITQERTLMENHMTQHHLKFYLGVYLLTSLISITLVAVKLTIVLLAALRASRNLFEITTLKILRAPLRWLDTEPTGRILNRFVGDFAMIDAQLGGSMLGCINGMFSIVIIIAAALFVSKWVLIPIAVLSTFSFYFIYLYLDATRDIKRLESTAKSPIFELVGSTISGLTTIRSFGRTDDYLARMYKHLDRYAQTSWYVALANKWMSLRQGIVGVLFTLATAVGVVYFSGIDASLAGFALSFALDFSDAAQVTTSRYAATELSMNATERVLEYANLETEKLTGVTAAATWPSSGSIVVRDLEVRYANHLEPALKGISFSVDPCQRIGIVGRTGSGKSSLTLALFRFLEARQGSIEIDGVDISTLNLHDLRSRLAIIPQDPVLFSGTLRSNLDPFNEYSDLQLLEALKRIDSANSMPIDSRSETSMRRLSVFNSGLMWPITSGGSNLSQGEKQLICLARAIITRPKILVLDEATSAVDMETDALIQRSIRAEFSSATLLVVAHRLSTIADFDKILVMSDGQIAEYDRPEVLAKRRGHFWNMVNDSGEKEALEHLL
ncbi:P-loop containing nucleoside triphosphate hydrolase protein [Polychaeton citri CBS 116435]|uniref:P-loop containing nucleoside triphosphate hydrolase protein n=1 Tax=Polychaeton citri CBS 116435 TaxID=1314669 RepID=A0A9P4Q3H9_9PEZI|nr:P-loop containing nucleoside triphosphate hydrolase protein [Polychaeton citri CBS 116435]